MAEGCAVEMKNSVSNHTYFFNVFLSSNEQAMDSTLNCFTIPETGEYTMCVHEIQSGGMVGENCWMLSNVTVEEPATIPTSDESNSSHSDESNSRE